MKKAASYIATATKAVHLQNWLVQMPAKPKNQYLTLIFTFLCY